MRTTLTIDDDILTAAKILASESGLSVGAVISELARKGLHQTPAVRYEVGFPVFEVREDATSFGSEDVDRALGTL